MLNKKIVESIFKDLNASAAKEWRDDCYLKLLYFEELEDDGEIYESIEDIWPDYPSKDDFFWNEEEY